MVFPTPFLPTSTRTVRSSGRLASPPAASPPEKSTKWSCTSLRSPLAPSGCPNGAETCVIRRRRLEVTMSGRPGAERAVAGPAVHVHPATAERHRRVPDRLALAAHGRADRLAALAGLRRVAPGALDG